MDERDSERSKGLFGITIHEETVIDNEKKPKFPLKYKIIIASIIIFVIILITSILFFLLRNKEERYYGRISCIFEVFNHSEPLQIISDDFSHSLDDIEIIANGTKVEDDKKYISNYTLHSNGFIDVIFNYRDNAEIYLDHIFKDIENLVSIKVASTEKAKILSIHKAFQNCSDVENITIKGFDTSNVTSMKKVFYNNSKLSSIILDDYFSTENVTYPLF
jgi:surface protein